MPQVRTARKKIEDLIKELIRKLEEGQIKELIRKLEEGYKKKGLQEKSL